MIERWLVAIRDHPDRPPAVQRLVLQSLALRMDWTTGTGYVSTGQLAADSDATERTVRRATKWGRDASFLLQMRRGHRLGNGQIAATEWKLTQPVTADLLTSQPDRDGISTGQSNGLNRTAEHPLQESFTSRTSTSARARANGASAPHARKPQPRACDRENYNSRHSEACRRGDNRDCRAPWCECACHARATAA